jgi:hypothetical protein
MTHEHEDVTQSDREIAKLLEGALRAANGDEEKLRELLRAIVAPLREIEARAQ